MRENYRMLHKLTFVSEVIFDTSMINIIFSITVPVQLSRISKTYDRQVEILLNVVNINLSINLAVY